MSTLTTVHILDNAVTFEVSETTAALVDAADSTADSTAGDVVIHVVEASYTAGASRAGLNIGLYLAVLVVVSMTVF